MPAIFYVNWFTKDEKGRFIWPGFTENIRVLKWMFDRIEGRAKAHKTPIGYVPEKGFFNTEGFTISQAEWDTLFAIDTKCWLKEVKELRGYFATFGNKLPKTISEELDKLETAFSDS